MSEKMNCIRQLYLFSVFCIKLYISAEVLTLEYVNNSVTCVTPWSQSHHSPVYLDPPSETASESDIRKIALEWKTNKHWENRISSNSLLGPVIDKRWENFRIEHSQSIIYKTVPKLIVFSVCTKDDLEIIIRSNSASIFQETISSETNQAETEMQNSCRWEHYSVKINKTNMEIYQNYSKRVTKSFDSNVQTEKITEIKIRTSEFSYWRKHDYTYLHKYLKADNNNNNKEDDAFKVVRLNMLHSGDFCVLFFVAVDGNSFFNISIQSGTTLVNKLVKNKIKTGLKQWQEVKLNINAENEVIIHIQKGYYYEEKDKFWAIDENNVFSCSEKYTTTYLKTYDNASNKHVCHVLNKEESSIVSSGQFNFPKPGFLTNDLECKKILPAFPQCEKHKIYLNGSGSGFCAWGFKPPSCTEKCDANYYGINCKEKCPENCVECDYIYGCKKCDDRYYGSNCNKTLKTTLYTNDNTLLVTWEQPDDNQYSKYSINAQMMNKLFCKRQSPSDSKFVQLDRDTLNHKFENITPFANYSITLIILYPTENHIKVVKNIMTHQSKKILGNELPPSIEVLTNNSINLKFNECNNFNGELNVSLSLMCVSEWCKNREENKLSVEINANTFKRNFILDFPHLLNFTNYVPKMRANRFNSEMNKEYNILKTKPGNPQPVRSLSFLRSSTDITLKWKPPYPPTGDISFYKIVYSDGTQNKSTNLTFHGSYDKELLNNITITNLTDNTNYSVTVFVKNEGIDKIKSSKKTINVWTDQKAPQPPSNLSISWDNSKGKIKISWQHPKYLRSSLQTFFIEIKNEKERFNYILKDFDDTNQYHLETSLEYFYNHSIMVFGQNKYAGNKSTIFTRLFPPLPDLTPSFPVIEQCDGPNHCFLTISENKNATYKKLSLKTIKKVNLKSISQEDDRLLGCFKELDKVNEWTVSDENAEDDSFMMINFGEGAGIMFSLHGKSYCISSTVDIPKGTTLKITIIAVCLTILVLVIAGYSIYAYKYYKFPFGDHKFNINGFRSLCRTNNVKTDEDEEVSDLLETHQLYENLKSFDDSQIHVSNLANYLMDSLESEDPNKSLLAKQFNSVPKDFQHLSKDSALLPQNKKKNRYINLLPYDSTRVKLEENGQDGDYINANFVDGYKAPKAFIATQAPRIKTIPHFWLMVWQQNVSTIMMMTELIEKGVVKAHQYWPDESTSVSFGKISVKNLVENKFPDYIQRELEVSYNNETRLIDHLQFISWPDHGVPMYPQSLIPLMKRLLAKSQKQPIVVHCSAGCGRTGTIILCDIALRMAEKEGRINFVNILTDIRQKRLHLVNSLDQYIFAHMLVLEYLDSKHFAIPVAPEFENEIVIALNDTKIKSMVDELDKVTTFFEKTRVKYQLVCSDEDKTKNRFPAILPRNAQVFLSQAKGSNYINAVYVDCYKFPKKFIVTQQPLDNTVEDFWRLVMEHDVNTIISLNEIEEGDPHCPKFWPEADKISVGTDVMVEFVEKHNYGDYDVITIKTKTVKEVESKMMYLIELKNWKRETPVPTDKSDLLFIWKEMFNNSWKENSKIIVTCYDGCTASGLFVALAFMLEKMNTEQVCDIFSAIRYVKQSRKEFIKESVQIQFLYEAALEYVKEFADYENFK